MCPKPPEATEEGIREYHPIPIPMTPEKICAVNEDEINLKCHSFLSIYLTKVWYGRNQSSGRVICDGDKPDDNQSPNVDCFLETYNNELKEDISAACNTEFDCNFTIPTVPIISACDGMKREARVEYICGRN